MLCQGLRYLAFPPTALSSGPWNHAWRDPRSALQPFIRTRDGDPTPLTASIARAGRRIFGLEIPVQYEVSLQTQNSTVAHPGLRQLEFGMTRLDFVDRLGILALSPSSWCARHT